ncbi:hypothetical protein DICPUDRAFT_156891 [Dictyostelium purpureum]|uniref:Uncharacterized protein n=1 Tax=Dictyostelium purpureum TaxID=5786 RepID=F0ZXP8_DICPU|nr:uncharacterized protein DICPUDRAFT_156891 [Dictyostelium purpureum]EGC31285.1 hypothetical protein DICPUDRAFT_156891 [Dictyostelium purpureum]|eukprot:XP_003292194.1 hypothetical protein DICPUDRAFT_156891 [Dictyostelium purpureum]
MKQIYKILTIFVLLSLLLCCSIVSSEGSIEASTSKGGLDPTGSSATDSTSTSLDLGSSTSGPNASSSENTTTPTSSPSNSTKPTITPSTTPSSTPSSTPSRTPSTTTPTSQPTVPPTLNPGGLEGNSSSEGSGSFSLYSLIPLSTFTIILISAIHLILV